MEGIRDMALGSMVTAEDNYNSVCDSKKIYLEYLRIIACVLVIYNHLSGYMLFVITDGASQFFYMILTMITKINVPIFFMITGTLLLGKEEDFKTVISKRILRFLLVILIFVGGLYVITYIQSVMAGEPLEKPLYNFIMGILNNNVCGIYWYLYAYLGFLFMLPFMQRIAKNIARDDICILLFLNFVFSSFIPLINIVLNKLSIDPISICNDFSVPLATISAFFYPLIGYYIDNKIDVSKFKNKHIIYLLLFGGIGIIISCWCTYYEGRNIGEYTQRYVYLFTYVIAIAVFLIVKYLVTVAFPKLSKGKIGKTITLIGSLTFGIYLFDPYLKTIFYRTYQVYIENHLPTIIASINWVLI